MRLLTQTLFSLNTVKSFHCLNEQNKHLFFSYCFALCLFLKLKKELHLFIESIIFKNVHYKIK